MYDAPTRFVETLERFRRESGVTDEQMQEVLTALYDYQEVQRYLRPLEPGRSEFLKGTSQWADDEFREAMRRIQDTLTPKQYMMFARIVRPVPWALLVYYHDAISLQDASEP